MSLTPMVSSRSSALPNGAASQLAMRSSSLTRSGGAFLKAVVPK